MEREEKGNKTKHSQKNHFWNINQIQREKDNKSVHHTWSELIHIQLSPMMPWISLSKNKNVSSAQKPWAAGILHWTLSSTYCTWLVLLNN